MDNTEHNFQLRMISKYTTKFHCIFQSSFVEVFTLSYLARQESHLGHTHINLYFLHNKQVRPLAEIINVFIYHVFL